MGYCGFLEIFVGFKFEVFFGGGYVGFQDRGRLGVWGNLSNSGGGLGLGFGFLVIGGFGIELVMVEEPELEEGETCSYRDDADIDPDIALSYIV